MGGRIGCRRAWKAADVVLWRYDSTENFCKGPPFRALYRGTFSPEDSHGGSGLYASKRVFLEMAHASKPALIAVRAYAIKSENNNTDEIVRTSNGGDADENTVLDASSVDEVAAHEHGSGAQHAKIMPLCDKIALLRLRDTEHVVPLIKEWEAEGNELNKETVLFIMRKLRQWKRPVHALKIADWMYFTRPFEFDSKDAIFRMELSARSDLLRKAERIFQRLDEKDKTLDAYNVLLLMYSQHKMLGYANNLYRKLKESKIALTNYTFNLLACLYRRCGVFKRIIDLLKDMEAAGIKPDLCFQNNLLVAKYQVEGIASAEQLFHRIISSETGSNVAHVATYSMMADAYISAGMHEKAESLLQEIEQGMEKNRFLKLRRTHNILISMYASLKNLAAMERVWGKIEDPTSEDFICMIEACGQAGQVLKAENYFKEADTRGKLEHSRMFSALLNVYAAAGLPEKSEVLFSKMKELNVVRDSASHHYLIVAHLKKNDIRRAMEVLETALVAGKSDGRSKPFQGTLAAVLRALANRGDVRGAETVFSDWKKASLKVNITLYNDLLNVYLKAQKPVDGSFLKRLVEDGMKPTTETHKLLEQLKLL